MDDRRSLPRKIFFGVVLLAASALHAESLAPKINAILANDQLKNASVSVTIAEVTNKGLVEHFSHQPDLALAPASNTKLMTTACAFEKYGAKAAFKTTLYKVGEDLLLVGPAGHQRVDIATLQGLVEGRFDVLQEEDEVEDEEVVGVIHHGRVERRERRPRVGDERRHPREGDGLVDRRLHRGDWRRAHRHRGRERRFSRLPARGRCRRRGWLGPD